MKTVILGNPGASQYDTHRDSIASWATPTGTTWIEPGRDESVTSRLEDTDLGTGDRLILAGGDGSIHRWINELPETKPRPQIGILPLGTGNDLARSLGMPLDPARAWEALGTGPVQPIDLGAFETEQGTRWFHNLLLGGNSVKVSQDSDGEWKRHLGPISYVVNSAATLLEDLTRHDVRLTVDGHEHPPRRLLNLMVANGRSVGGGFRISDEARLDSGFLEIILIHDAEPLEIARILAGTALADLASNPHVERLRGRQVRIESDPPLPFTLDGQIVDPTDAQVGIRPRALPMIIGPDDPAIGSPGDRPGPLFNRARPGRDLASD